MSIEAVVMWGLTGVFIYYALLHGSYLALIAMGAMGLRRYHRGIHVGDFQRVSSSDMSPPFSVIIPAYNEETMIVGTIEAALGLRYPEHEVIVVNDGSSDLTLEQMIKRFGLVRVDRFGSRVIPTRDVIGVYESASYPNLLVLDKLNGKRADAINAGANQAQYPLLCIMDADCVFEEDALVRAARPFMRSQDVIAAGGIVRPANGLKLSGGRIQSFDLPRNFLALMQCVEYLRSFQWARLGLARVGAMLSISGAFMVVRRSVFMDMGGIAVDSVTDDIEFTVRLHRYAHENSSFAKKLRVDYIPDPVCYTEVPETAREFYQQRNRWQRGIMQALWRHKKMTLNPSYGTAGMVGMPFFFLFEAAAGVIEVGGYILMLMAIALGLASLQTVVVFLLFAVVLGTLLSLLAVLLQEHTRMRTANIGELARFLGASLVSNLGYHQFHLVARLAGTLQYAFGNRNHVGTTKRIGRYQHGAAQGAHA